MILGRRLGRKHSDRTSPPNPQSTLPGDWGGPRPYLERKGVVFNLNCTNNFLSNVRGGIGPGTVGNHGGSDVPGSIETVVDGSAGSAIHHPSGRWRSQQ